MYIIEGKRDFDRECTGESGEYNAKEEVHHLINELLNTKTNKQNNKQNKK